MLIKTRADVSFDSRYNLYAIFVDKSCLKLFGNLLSRGYIWVLDLHIHILSSITDSISSLWDLRLDTTSNAVY